MEQTTFQSLKLVDPLQRALQEDGYLQPTEIQIQAIPHLLDGGDLLGCAQTGTGKTAAFALPMLQRLQQLNRKPASRRATALVLTPTRELAVQIAKSYQRYGRYLKLRSAVVYGGVGIRPQINSLKNGVDVLIATPGRLLDLIQQGAVGLESTELLVLDEADRMLDMGFIRDVRKISGMLPEKRQTLLFSATMSPEVSKLANSLLNNPKTIRVAPAVTTAERIDDRVLFVESENKSSLLLEVLQSSDYDRALVFTRTKHRANRLAKKLSSMKVRAEAIHGNKSQGARQRALKDFSKGKVRILVATDVVSRGIDISGISHVINFELPNDPESYVHRIGRTARAGRSGVAVSFCDQEEVAYLVDIEKLLQRKVQVDENHAHHAEGIAQQHASPKRQGAKRKARPARPPRRRNRAGQQNRKRSAGGRRTDKRRSETRRTEQRVAS